MYFHVVALLWPCVCVAATEVSEPSTTATRDMSQISTLNQPYSLRNTTIPDDGTPGQTTYMAMNCVTPPTWDTRAFRRTDCLGAIDWLYLETGLTECFSQPCTFYGSNSKIRIQKDNAQPTPRMYTFKSCTIAIIMLNDFKPGELPGGDIKGVIEDITSYGMIEEISRSIVRNCVMERKLYGWVPTGSKRSMGIFIWATGSKEDLHFRDTDPDQIYISPTVFNVSAAVA